MDIESALPEDFDELSNEGKIRELESILDKFDEETDAGALKKRMVEELIRNYKED